MPSVVESEASSRFMLSLGGLASQSLGQHRDIEEESRLLDDVFAAGWELSTALQSHLEKLEKLKEADLADTLEKASVDLAPLLAAFSLLNTLPAIKETPLNLVEIASLDLSVRGLALKQVELKNRVDSFTATEETLRDFPDILERIERYEAGEETFSLEELAAEYGIEV